MPYIDCFYVCEDIAHRGPLNIKKFDCILRRPAAAGAVASGS